MPNLFSIIRVLVSKLASVGRSALGRETNMIRIRLRRQGSKDQRSYQIVVFNLRKESKGRYLEKIGHFKPRTQLVIVIKEERALYWLSVGAQPDGAVRRILDHNGTWDRFLRLQAGENIDDLVREAEATRKELPSPKTNYPAPGDGESKIKAREADQLTDEASSDPIGESNQQSTGGTESDLQPIAGPSESGEHPQVTNEFTNRDDDSNLQDTDEIAGDRQPKAGPRESEARPHVTDETDDKVGANEPTSVNPVDSRDEANSVEPDELKLYSNLNRLGKTKLNDEFVPPLPLSDPDFRRRRKQAELNESIANEPELVERTRPVLTRRVEWEGKDPATREFLKQQYGGRCQICNYTFPKHDGEPYFEGLYIESYKKAEWLDDPANVLCLCANHSAQFLNGAREFTPDFRTQVLSYAGGKSHVLNVKLIGEDLEIRFTESHIIDLKTFVEVSENA